MSAVRWLNESRASIRGWENLILYEPLGDKWILPSESGTCSHQEIVEYATECGWEDPSAIKSWKPFAHQARPPLIRPSAAKKKSLSLLVNGAQMQRVRLDPTQIPHADESKPQVADAADRLDRTGSPFLRDANDPTGEEAQPNQKMPVDENLSEGQTGPEPKNATDSDH